MSSFLSTDIAVRTFPCLSHAAAGALQAGVSFHVRGGASQTDCQPLWIHSKAGNVDVGPRWKLLQPLFLEHEGPCFFSGSDAQFDGSWIHEVLHQRPACSER